MRFKQTPLILSLSSIFLLASCASDHQQESVAAEHNRAESSDLVEAKQENHISTVREQFMQAEKYMDGVGIEQDYAKAAHWYQKVAGLSANGNRHDARLINQAQLYLGLMYGEGAGVEQDFTKAVEWLEKAASGGSASAQLKLSYYYSEGKGVEKNIEKSIFWLHNAADLGSAKASVVLGWLYESGLEVKQDLKLAAYWYQNAADKEYIPAFYAIGRMYEDGRGVEQDEGKAVTWLTRAAEYDYVEAQVRLGQLYSNTYSARKSKQKAIKWYKKAADQGHYLAQPNLAEVYLNQDKLVSAAYWYLQSAKREQDYGFSAVMELYRDILGFSNIIQLDLIWVETPQNRDRWIERFNMGLVLQEGNSVEQNIEQSLQQYDSVVEENSAEAQFNLGRIYLLSLLNDFNSEDVTSKSNFIAMVKHLENAAKKNHIEAMALLGAVHLPANDVEKASVWLKRAYDRGDAKIKEAVQLVVKKRFSWETIQPFSTSNKLHQSADVKSDVIATFDDRVYLLEESEQWYKVLVVETMDIGFVEKSVIAGKFNPDTPRTKIELSMLQGRYSYQPKPIANSTYNHLESSYYGRKEMRNAYYQLDKENAILEVTFLTKPEIAYGLAIDKKQHLDKFCATNTDSFYSFLRKAGMGLKVIYQENDTAYEVGPWNKDVCELLN